MASPQIKGLPFFFLNNYLNFILERCYHLKTIKDGYSTNCIFCGLRILDEGKVCYKSNMMCFTSDISSFKVHERMMKQLIFLPKRTNFYFGEYLRVNKL